MAKFVRKPKVNIPLYIAGVLFCLTLVSTYMVTGLFARYTAGGTGSDSARVIKFGDLSITQASGADKKIIPGVDIAHDVTVSFTGSESATYVFVQLVSDKWTCNSSGEILFGKSDLLKWNVAEGWSILSDKKVFYRSLGPNTALDNVPVIRDGKITVSTNITKSNVSDFAGTLSFRASVVQSNGFDSPAAAWASLESKGGGA